MSWSKRPRSRVKRIAWLKRFAREERKRLARGFNEAFYYGRGIGRRPTRHWTVAQQTARCLANIQRAEKELEALNAA